MSVHMLRVINELENNIRAIINDSIKQEDD